MHTPLLVTTAILLLVASAHSAPGDLDTALIGGTGIVLGASGENFLEDVAVQSDGKIVTVGSTYNSVSGRTEFVIQRYLGDGSPDSSFNGTGIAFAAPANRSAAASSVLIEPDGKIVVAGLTLQGGPFDSTANVAVVRLLTNGTPDPAFGSGGTALTVTNEAIFDFSEFQFSRTGVARQADGKIIVTGGMNGDFAVIRYLANGTPDNGFSGDGIVTTSLTTGTDRARYVSVQTDGKLVVCGDAGAGQDAGVVRYLSDGTLDNTFSGDGKMISAHTDQTEIRDMVLQPDGKIILCGWTFPVGAGWPLALVLRFTGSGDPDPAFNTTGIVKTAVTSVSTYFEDIVVQSDGKLVAAGQAWDFGGANQALVVRYLTDGSPDPSFGNGGIVITPGYYGTAVALQTDGKVVVAGSLFISSFSSRYALARYHGTSALSPLQAWRQLHFGSPGATGDASDGADPDRDTVPNLVEYVTGTNPKSGSSSPPAWQRTGNNLTWTFTTPSSVPGATLAAEKSNSLAAPAWVPIPNNATPPAYSFSVPIDASGRLFVRLRASVP